jgi:hypothetical protein
MICRRQLRSGKIIELFSEQPSINGRHFLLWLGQAEIQSQNSKPKSKSCCVVVFVCRFCFHLENFDFDSNFWFQYKLRQSWWFPRQNISFQDQAAIWQAQSWSNKVKLNFPNSKPNLAGKAYCPNRTVIGVSWNFALQNHCHNQILTITIEADSEYCHVIISFAFKYII